MSAAFEKLVQGMLEQGYGQSSGLLTEETLMGLRKRIDELIYKDELRAARVGPLSDEHHIPSIRSDEIYWIDPHSSCQSVSVFLHMMEELAQYLTQTCFISLNRSEFHFARYQPGSLYQRHLDGFRGGQARQFSIILYLNHDWGDEDGGELVLYLPSDHGERAVKVQPRWGQLILFESHRLEHEVLATHRDRYSLTGWLRYDDLSLISS